MSEHRTTESGEQVISEDKTRAVTREVFAFACYELDEAGLGKHVGIHHKLQDAWRWLETGEPKPQPIYPLKVD